MSPLNWSKGTFSGHKQIRKKKSSFQSSWASKLDWRGRPELWGANHVFYIFVKSKIKAQDHCSEMLKAFILILSSKQRLGWFFSCFTTWMFFEWPNIENWKVYLQWGFFSLPFPCALLFLLLFDLTKVTLSFPRCSLLVWDLPLLFGGFLRWNWA